ncbi:hypothetical protein KIH27_12415 [Mycobacterium sp. M1]|uniref:DUF7159 domain-containing protein n=1 Tax=Mycolicibacter acidiphilus TaxID=2835306 RepID=A0ABS5RJC5_9MYCO|nr:hypothetical protein [Mycolicibacter acidiphilus]MBS9534388.1 hypothetical protein [Mycolicibacter acidiphilus]
MGAVLGVSLSAGHGGVVVLDGVGADARTVIRDSVAVFASEMDAVATAVAQAARTAASRGYPVQAVGLTCTVDVERCAVDLASRLADSGIAEIELVDPVDATAALAEVIAASRRSQCATVSLLAGDATIAAFADGRGGVHRPAVTLHHGDATLATLNELVADRRADAVFVMVPRALAVDGFAERLERALAPRMAEVLDAELGLARGAALAAGQSARGGDGAADQSTVPVQQRLHRTHALLFGLAAATLLVAAVTVALVRAGTAHNAAEQTPRAASPSSAVAPPVSAAENASTVRPPVSAPEPAEPQVAEAGEVRLQTMAEPLAESAPVPDAPPVGAPPPAPVEEPAASPIQDAIAFVEQALGIDVDNDGLIGGRAATPAPNSEHAP